MTNPQTSNQLQGSSQPTPGKKAAWFLAVFSFVGILDAGYLTMQHYFSLPLPCSVLNGCHTVTSSQYSEIFGIPIALGGLIFYVAMFLMAVTIIDSGKEKVVPHIYKLSIAGLLVSAYLVYLQLFVINALCLYCFISATNTVLLFVGAIFLRKAILNASSKETQI